MDHTAWRLPSDTVPGGVALGSGAVLPDDASTDAGVDIWQRGDGVGLRGAPRFGAARFGAAMFGAGRWGTPESSAATPTRQAAVSACGAASGSPSGPADGWSADACGIPTDEAALEDLLSTPGEGAIEAVRGLSGDLVVVGAGGKVGPTLARMARRALDAAGSSRRVIAVSRYADAAARDRLESWGIDTVSVDLSEQRVWDALPEAGAVMYLLGHKFGSGAAPHVTWWSNAVVPGFAASRYRGVPTVVYSSGNVYPLVAPHTGGCRESDAVGPVGAYAQSCVAREEVFAHAAATWGTPVAVYRLNYAVELRYGVLVDLAETILAGQPVDVTTGSFNVVWQRDSSEWSLRLLPVASAPPVVVNGTGPETASTRAVALRLGELLGRRVEIVGEEAEEALLSDGARCHGLFGYPSMPLDRMLQWTATWVAAGGRRLARPTKFQVRDGRF